MDKIIKSTLKIQIEAYLTKFADPTLKDVKKWLFDLCMEYEGNPNNINSNMYYAMIKEMVGPAVLEVYPEGNAIFQDDAASIHRTEAVCKQFLTPFVSGLNTAPRPLKPGISGL